MLLIVVEVAGTVCDADCSIFSQTVDWPFAMLKYAYIFQMKYTDAIFIKQHSELNCYG